MNFQFSELAADSMTWPVSGMALEWLIIFVSLAILGLMAALLAGSNQTRTDRPLHPADTATAGRNNWHAMTVEQVVAFFDADLEGLTAEQVGLRLAKFGANRLPEPKTQSPLLRFFSQFHNILIYVLLAACAVTAILEHWLDTSVIFSVVIINALIGFIQEGKAENALRAISRMLSPKAMLLRNRQRIIVDAEQICPGDVVLLQSGDKVPADLRLFKTHALQIQEAVLTGESVPVTKNTSPVEPHTELGDRSNMAYSGTLVTHGQGAGIAVATGRQTEIGHISDLVATVANLTTPLLRQISRFGRWLTAAILIIAAFTFGFGIGFRDYAPSEMFLAAVGLAVAAIPEGLPAIITITLAIGVQRMAKRKAIIRRLPAVETLGSVAVICTDKTGTLTRNEMTVKSIVTSDNFFRVSGTGYDPHGAFVRGQQQVDPAAYPVLVELLRAAVLCNDTDLEWRNSEWRIHGDPMEGALLIAALKATIDIGNEKQRFPHTDLIPFESEHRFMATLHHNHLGEAFIFVKGAPERILQMCHRQRSAGGDRPLDDSVWRNEIETLAKQGQRVLAMAVKAVPAQHMQLEFDDVADRFTLLGVFGLIDPPRDEAVSAIRQCRAAGIRVIMITGDHGATAQAIAGQLQLNNPHTVLSGRDLETMDEQTLRRRVAEVDIYARVSPEHKLLLVKLLQELGQIVAMTGDGVNDAPALKRADVGTAMGMKGTEAAKEAAEMVLADDNFASLVHAVEEGRTVFDNLRKAILFILPSNGGEALIVITAVLFGYHQLPLTPAQILWVNMITTVTLALVLSFEPPEPDIMHRPPRPANAPVLSRLLLWRIVFVSVILMTGTFGLFLWEMNRGMPIEHARTVAVNTLVWFEIFYLFNARYITAPVLNRQGLFGNRYILIAISLLIVFQFGLTYFSYMQRLFDTTDISIWMWGRIILVASSVLVLVELEKALIRFFQRRRPPG